MKKCFECETTEDLQEHHVVPRSRGGSKTVTLCYECHMKAHGRTGKGLDHSRLTKEGLARAKARGVKLGGTREGVMKGRQNATKATNSRVFPHIKDAIEQGCSSQAEIALYLNNKGIKTPRGKAWTRGGTLHRVLRRYKKQNTEISKEDK